MGDSSSSGGGSSLDWRWWRREKAPRWLPAKLAGRVLGTQAVASQPEANGQASNFASLPREFCAAILFSDSFEGRQTRAGVYE
jgi:hypothetical protein